MNTVIAQTPLATYIIQAWGGEGYSVELDMHKKLIMFQFFSIAY